MAKNVDFSVLLKAVQAHISENHAAALTSPRNYNQIKPYIRHYLRSNALFVEGMSTEEVVEELYSEMVEYSFLTPYMNRDDVEEININAWNDVAISYTNGTIEKIRHFYSPTHALDVVKKMLDKSRMTLDNAMPKAEGQLPNNARITATMFPLVDESVYVSASIRLLHPSRITTQSLLEEFESATPEMLEFLCCCMRYGISFVVAGATSSGKTTLLNALLKNYAKLGKRIFTLEAGSRELDLVEEDEEGNVTTNVVHTLARKSDKPAQVISLEDLVTLSLRYNPDLIVVGEMRDVEAYAAIDAALTGHTLVSTIHAYAGAQAHMRLATLCQKKYPMDLNISLMQAAQAFPVVCFVQKLDDGTRKITNISECEVDAAGNRKYHTLFSYEVDSTDIVNGKVVIDGHYVKGERMSRNLKERMVMFGIPSGLLKKIDR